MTKKKDFTERRKHNRFKVNNGAFALIGAAPAKLDQIKDMSMGEIALATYKAKPLMMGQIKNISKKGLTFRYVDNGKEATEPSELDIIFAQDAFYLKNVPFKSVADFNEASEFQFSSIAMRQRCVQFKEMMPIQTFLLYYFIQNYTRDKT